MLSNPAEETSGGDIVAEINVTPLTDIFLVLLIIFMVTSTALVQQGTPVQLPRAAATGAEPSGVVITVTRDRRVEVNGRAVDFDGLQPALEAAFRAAGDRTAVLRGDRAVLLEDAVRIMTIARRAGAQKLAIATERE